MRANIFIFIIKDPCNGTIKFDSQFTRLEYEERSDNLKFVNLDWRRN